MGVKGKQHRHLNAIGPGFELHWYEIKGLLGQGGFGITYLAYDKNLAHEVAIKEYMPVELATRAGDKSVMPASADQEERYRWGLERFIEEARTLGQFKHPNIVRVRNVFEYNNTAYMVMDYELGESLQDILSRRKILDEPDIRTILFPIMDGMQQVHAHGFIHRDIKPGNIYIRVDGDPVLLDFGSARQAMEESHSEITGTFSRGYAPIEQYSTHQDTQGPWTDIYALGATLYRAIAGMAPNDAVDRQSAISKTSRDTYVSAREIGDGRYSASLLNAIDMAMRFNPDERPQNITGWMQAFADDTPDTGNDPAATTGDPMDDSLVRTLEQAETGDVTAQSSLAYRYARGIQTEKNESEAARWYERAAQQGHINSQFNLGVMYSRGRGVEQDFRKAYHWYSEAAMQGDATAQATLYMLYTRGIGVEKNDRLAFEWCQLAARQGHLDSIFRLGDMYWHGQGVDQNHAQAFRWFRQAANRGHINAQLNLAYMYGKGQGVGRDDLEAYQWYRKAAQSGNAQAQFNLGVIYAKGRGIRRDLSEARRWYETAANQGNANAEKALVRLG